MTYIGVDNGVTGTVGIINKDKRECFLPEKYYHKFLGKTIDISFIYPYVEKVLIGLEPPFFYKHYKSTIGSYLYYCTLVNYLDKEKIHYEIVNSNCWRTVLFKKGFISEKKRLIAKEEIYQLAKKECNFCKVKKNDADGYGIAKYLELSNEKNTQ